MHGEDLEAPAGARLERAAIDGHADAVDLRLRTATATPDIVEHADEAVRALAMNADAAHRLALITQHPWALDEDEVGAFPLGVRLPVDDFGVAIEGRAVLLQRPDGHGDAPNKKAARRRLVR